MSKLWTALSLAAAAGCGNNHTVPAADQGVADLSFDNSDLRPPMVANGTRIVAGNLTLLGVTSDDRAIIFDLETRELKAAPLSGGAPQPIIINPGFVAISGGVVFAWTAYDTTTRIGALHSWTPVGGTTLIGAGSPAVAWAASDDATRITYMINARPDGRVADLHVANVDGTSSVKVLSAKLTTTPCSPLVKFAGGRVFSSTCLEMGGAGATAATISSVSAAAPTTATDLVTNALHVLRVDAAGTRVVAVDQGGNALLVPGAGGPATTLDTGVTSAHILPDGLNLLWAKGGALIGAATATPATRLTLAPAGARIIDFLSPDGIWVVAHDLETPFATDILVAQTKRSGRSTRVSDKADTAIYGDAFSTDAMHLLYFTDAGADFVGTFNVKPLGGGLPTREIAQRVWWAFAATGSKIIFTDNYGSGLADIHLVDLNNSAQRTLIATQADDATRFFNAARTAILYVYRAEAGKEGLYVFPVQ